MELIHGVSQLPDGYGKIFNTAAMLLECCLNAVENAVYMDAAQVWGGPRATEHTKECLLLRRPGC